jgi:hypothetical protein
LSLHVLGVYQKTPIFWKEKIEENKREEKKNEKTFNCNCLYIFNGDVRQRGER